MKKNLKKSLRFFAAHSPYVKDLYTERLNLRNNVRSLKEKVQGLENIIEVLNSRYVTLNQKDESLLKELAQQVYEKELMPEIVTPKTEMRKSKKLENVLQINTADTKGGAAKVSYRLMEKLNERNLISNLLVDQIYSDNKHIKQIPRESSLKQNFLYEFQEKEGWLDFFHLSSFKIKELEEFKNADILHLHNLHGNYFSLFSLPKLTSLKPTIWTLHDMQPITPHCAHSFDCELNKEGFWECPSLDIYPAIKKDVNDFLCENKARIYKNSKFTLVCPSVWLKNKVEKSILGTFKTELIYNGVDEKIFKNTNKLAARRYLNLPLDKKILLFTADMGIKNPWKGGEFLLKAYESLKNDESILFLSVGGKKDENQMSNWIDVGYIGNEEKMALYYAASDLFIYPTLADNCPLTVLESLSCGTPVITFEVGGVPELVNHMETGYIAKSKNIKDFVNGIQSFLHEDELMVKASALARSEVEKKFTLNKMTDNYINIYNKVLQI